MVPSKINLREIIAQGDNTVNNSVILNKLGKFELRNFNETDINNDPTIIVRYETLSFDSDYVGKAASEDDAFIDELYKSMLEGWIIYLKIGKPRVYTDGSSSRISEDGLIEIIKELSN